MIESDCCLTPNEQFFSYIMARTNHIQRDDDAVHIVLDQHTFFFYCGSSLKQQSASRHVAPLGHNILITSQLVYAFTPKCCVLSVESANPNLIDFGLIYQLKASMLTITPPIQLKQK